MVRKKNKKKGCLRHPFFVLSMFISGKNKKTNSNLESGKKGYRDVIDFLLKKSFGYTWNELSLFVKCTSILLVVMIGYFSLSYNVMHDEYYSSNLSASTSDSSFIPLLLSSNTGGIEFITLGNEFVKQNYVCDGNLWKVGGNGGVSTAYYGSRLSLGKTFQIDFVPDGDYASNLAVGVFDLFELVIGDNSFKHLSLKGFQSDDFISLNSVIDGNYISSSTRIRLENSLSTSSENLLLVEANLVSSTSMVIRIVINGEVFESDELFVRNQEKYEGLYLALLDTDENNPNHTGVFFPELRVCQ